MTIRRKSAWKEDAEYRVKNRWLSYSSRIAMRIKVCLDSKKQSQTDFAVSIGVSEQWISKVIKGKENLTLESIYKISQALGVELISFPDFKYSMPFIQSQTYNTHTEKSFKMVIAESIVNEGCADVLQFQEMLTFDYKTMGEPEYGSF